MYRQFSGSSEMHAMLFYAFPCPVTEESVQSTIRENRRCIVDNDDYMNVASEQVPLERGLILYKHRTTTRCVRVRASQRTFASKVPMARDE